MLPYTPLAPDPVSVTMPMSPLFRSRWPSEDAVRVKPRVVG